MTSKIDWCDETSNPFHGCNGPNGNRCFYCYAERFAKRLGGNEKAKTYRELKRRGLDPFSPCFSVRSLSSMSKRWSTLRSSKRIFLGSMGDLGGDWRYHVIDRLGVFHRNGLTADRVRLAIIEAIREQPRHIFLILTKNPSGLAGYDWPPNVHIGVSVSGPAYAEERIPILLGEVDAAVSWASVEPLLGGPFISLYDDNGVLDWVVIGAETGSGSIHEPKIAEAQQLVLMCRARGVPVFVKQNMIDAFPDWDWPRELPELTR